MKGTKHSAPHSFTKSNSTSTAYRTSARDYPNPVDYKHPFPSMARIADLLALHYDANRTRHAYYRQIRHIQEHCNTDPSSLNEVQVGDYFLFVKLRKRWQP